MWYKNAVSLCCHVMWQEMFILFIYLLVWRGLLSNIERKLKTCYLFTDLCMYVYFILVLGNDLIAI